jgi:hypothetical protein
MVTVSLAAFATRAFHAFPGDGIAIVKSRQPLGREKPADGNGVNVYAQNNGTVEGPVSTKTTRTCAGVIIGEPKTRVSSGPSRTTLDQLGTLPGKK